MNPLSISVVIPNYNGENLLKENIPFLIDALKKCGSDYEIIITDDASQDGSVGFIEKNYPEIILIKKIRNEGFSHTVNKGVERASKQLTFILNSDVKLTGDYFTPQFKYFEKENTFGVMGRIIGIDNDSIQDGPKYPEMKGIKLKSTINYLPQKISEEEWLPTLFLSGANALTDTAKLKSLRGFSEIYSPFYGEDVDLSLRAWRSGWECYYEHRSICRHPASTTIASYNKKKRIKIISQRNRFILHAIHLDGLNLLSWLSGVMMELLVRWISLRGYYYSSFYLFIKMLPQVREAKRNFKAKVSLLDIITNIKKRISKFHIKKF